jgi:hypothetical protein
MRSIIRGGRAQSTAPQRSVVQNNQFIAQDGPSLVRIQSQLARKATEHLRRAQRVS